MTSVDSLPDRSWRDEISSAVTALGFAGALRRHIADIGQAHSATVAPERIADLHSWMSADPVLREILPPWDGTTAPSTVAASPTAPPEPPHAEASPDAGRTPDIREGDGSAMWLRWQEPFANWG